MDNFHVSHSMDKEVMSVMEAVLPEKEKLQHSLLAARGRRSALKMACQTISGHVGDPFAMMELYGITASDIAEKARAAVRMKR